MGVLIGVLQLLQAIIMAFVYISKLDGKFCCWKQHMFFAESEDMKKLNCDQLADFILTG